MKQGIHPDYHRVKVIMTDGTEFYTRSTYGKEGDVITLDVDCKSHHAWTGGFNIKKTGQVEKFAQRFGDFNFKTKKN